MLRFKRFVILLFSAPQLTPTVYFPSSLDEMLELTNSFQFVDSALLESLVMNMSDAFESSRSISQYRPALLQPNETLYAKKSSENGTDRTKPLSDPDDAWREMERQNAAFEIDGTDNTMNYYIAKEVLGSPMVGGIGLQGGLWA